jgi:hypothetical protein
MQGDGEDIKKKVDFEKNSENFFLKNELYAHPLPLPFLFLPHPWYWTL